MQRVVSGFSRASNKQAVIKQPYASMRGVFEDFASAQKAIKGKFISYNDVVIVNNSQQAIDSSVEMRDFPVLHFLGQLIHKKNISVVDFGGGVAVHFYKIKNFYDVSCCSWHVIELDAMVERGIALSKMNNITNLTFSTDVQHVPLCEIFLASGAIQYIENYENVLLYAKKAKYILITRLPVSDKDFVTIQNIGRDEENLIPVRIFHKQKIIDFPDPVDALQTVTGFLITEKIVSS
jgi:putative methyltransferase (TIGR04325 family)